MRMKNDRLAAFLQMILFQDSHDDEHVDEDEWESSLFRPVLRFFKLDLSSLAILFLQDGDWLFQIRNKRWTLVAIRTWLQLTWFLITEIRLSFDGWIQWLVSSGFGEQRLGQYFTVKSHSIWLLAKRFNGIDSAAHFLIDYLSSFPSGLISKHKSVPSTLIQHKFIFRLEINHLISERFPTLTICICSQISWLTGI